MTKNELRKIYKDRRLALTGKERLRFDDLLLIHFQRLHLPPVTRVMSYWPLEHNAEPNTFLFSDFLEFRIPGLQLAFPKADFTTNTMQAVAVNDNTHYRKNKYGLAEPDEGDIIPPDRLDLIFVPLLAFDKKGYRVGYGKGFYDRFLKETNPKAVKLGLSYFEPEERIEDADEFDVPLTIGITPNSIYEF
jgi:5-formyltetrahydrofolate cyclo-ligase